MTNKPNPYAHILRAIVDAKQIQWQNGNDKWADEKVVVVLYEIAREEFKPERYRVAPDTVTINSIEVPAPEKVAPAHGTMYWTFTPFGGARVTTWLSDEEDYHALKNGFVWLTEADAKAAFDAVTKPLREYVSGVQHDLHNPQPNPRAHEDVAAAEPQHDNLWRLLGEHHLAPSTY